MTNRQKKDMIFDPMGMRDMLERAKEQLPQLLADEEAWGDVDVNYHPPRVERLWRPFEDGRLFLHEIHPCVPDAALLHPHPWASGMYLLDGEYEMGYGRADPEGPAPTDIDRRIVTAGETYIMEFPDEWHYVAPVRNAVRSVMVIGEPWKRTTPKKRVDHGLSRIEQARRRELFGVFRSFFPSA